MHHVEIRIGGEAWELACWDWNHFMNADEDNPPSRYYNKAVAMGHIKKDVAWMAENLVDGVDMTRYRIKTTTTYKASPPKEIIHKAKSATEILKEA